MEDTFFNFVDYLNFTKLSNFCHCLWFVSEFNFLLIGWKCQGGLILIWQSLSKMELILNQIIWISLCVELWLSVEGVDLMYMKITWQMSLLCINSWAPGRPGCHFQTTIFNLVLLICFFTLSNDNALRWIPWDLTYDKSSLVQVMAWCRQATSHYLSQCWPNSRSPYGFTRPEWVNSSGCDFRHAAFNLVLLIGIFRSYDNVLIWIL